MSNFGVVFTTLALAIGLFFFIFYAARYYAFTATVLILTLLGKNGRNGKNSHRNGNESRNGINHIALLGRTVITRQNGKLPTRNGYANGNGQNRSALASDIAVEPFVSIHLPLYNEPNVADRLLAACTSLDYKNYEVIVIDDSTDGTIDILGKWAESNRIPVTLTDGGTHAEAQVIQTIISFRTPVKIIHRASRRGFKGGALNEAIKYMNPKAEFVIVFDADFIPPPDIIRRFLAYFATTPPYTVLAKLAKLDREYAEGKISMNTYLTERQSLSSKIAENRILIESFRVAQRSLFELDQLFANGTIDEDEYLVRRNAVMRELSKSSRVDQSAENRLALKQSFAICKLFSEDRVDLSDFKIRMQMVSPSSPKRVRPKNEIGELFLQILDLDQKLAKSDIDLKTYANQRETLAAQLLALSESRDQLKAKFELDQQLAKGKITFGEYLAEQNGNNGKNVPKRIIQLFEISGSGGNAQEGRRGYNGNSPNEENGYAAVQGYQLHYLNSSENWLTQGIRAEFSGNYMIERTCEEIFGTMKMIAGSVYIIKADILRKYRWAESLTEDWELTCRLYRDGNKVAYAPTIQAPAECPSTIKRVIRQRQRWAEGHTYNAKRYFWSILKSPHLTIREKLEFAYFAPYYLQSVFFIVGTLFWFMSEYLHEYLPYWSQTFGWALLFSNLMALPIMNLAGLFSEGSAKKNLSGIFSAIVLSYVLSIFQAYAALKGLLGKKEGTWIRTYKTGIITETIRKFQVGKFWRSLRRPTNRSTHAKAPKSTPAPRKGRTVLLPRAARTTVWGFALLLVLTTSLMVIVWTATTVPVTLVFASPGTTWYLSSDAGPTTAADYDQKMYQDSGGGGSFTVSGSNKEVWFASSNTYSGTINAQTWTYNVYVSGSSWPSGRDWTVRVGYILTTALGTFNALTAAHTFATCTPICSQTLSASDSQASPVTPSGSYYIVLEVKTPSGNNSATLNATTGNLTATQDIPEFAIVAAPIAIIIPKALSRWRKKQGVGKGR